MCSLGGASDRMRASSASASSIRPTRASASMLHDARHVPAPLTDGPVAFRQRGIVVCSGGSEPGANNAGSRTW